MANPQLEDLDDLRAGARIEEDDTGQPDGFAGEEISLEQLEEELQAQTREEEMDEDGTVDTQHGDGTAYYPLKAQQQGLVYIPPDDPPILPSDDLQGIEIAAGFGKEVELDDPRPEDTPERLAGNDWDLQARIMTVLRKSSLTNQMTAIQVQVEDGVAYLSGEVETLDDIDIVCSVVQDIDGVKDVEEELIVTSL
jgi:hypothetical protein